MSFFKQQEMIVVKTRDGSINKQNSYLISQPINVIFQTTKNDRRQDERWQHKQTKDGNQS